MIRDDVAPALAALDRALRDRTDLVYDDLVAAVRCLVQLRNRLIADGRRGARDDNCLKRLNALLSQVVASEYPLEGIRRERVKKARDEVAALAP